MNKKPKLWKLNLLDFGYSKLTTVKIIKYAYDLGIKEAKELSDEIPLIIGIEISEETKKYLEKELSTNNNQFKFLKK